MIDFPFVETHSRASLCTTICREVVMKYQNFYFFMKTTSIVIILMTFVLFSGKDALSSAIPDTGQKQSYTNIFGEDSDYQINPQTYKKLDENGNALSDTAEIWSMIQDEVTGLIWEIKKNNGTIQDSTQKFFWYEPDDKKNGGYAGINGDNTDTNDYIRALNNQHYGGFADWRLPNIYELASILNMSNTTSGIQIQFFPNTAQGAYWTSNTYAADSQKAWHISFITGKNGYEKKSSALYVRAVRGSTNTLVLSRFKDNEDGTITDTLTGLMWQKQDEQNLLTWEASLTQFNTLFLGGYSDWRMPTREELRSITDFSTTVPSIFSTYFPNTVSGNYWTSTPNPYQNDHIWCIHLYNGNDNFQTANNKYYSRAVRGGQHQTDNKIVIISPAQGTTWQKESPMPIQWNTRGIGGDVEISISRNGGLFGSFETISGHESNDGSFNWLVSGENSSNCAIQIIPLDAPEKANIQSFVNIIPAQLPVLEVSPLEFNVSPLPGNLNIAIINDGSGFMDWQAVVQEPWIHIQNSISGTGNYELDIQYDANSGSSRTGHLVITAPESLNSPQTVLIHQQSGYPIINISPTPQTISSIVGTVSLTITNTGTTFLAWTASTNADWLTFIGASTGTDTGTIVLRSEYNANEIRTGTITITAPNAINSPTSATIIQNAGYPLLLVSPESQLVDAWSGTTGITVVNAGAGTMFWNAESLSDWLIIESGYSGINDGIISVRFRSNYGDERTGSIKISTDNNQAKTVSIQQLAGFPILSVTPEIHDVSGNHGEVTFTIGNSGSGTMAWSALSNENWLTIVSDNTGTDSGTIQVAYDKNPGNPRTGNISVFASDAQIKTVQVSVHQDTQKGYYPPDWTYTPKDFQFQSMVIALVYNNDSQPMVKDNDLLAAFIDDECRGMVYPQDSPFGKRYFLQVWSNTQNEAVTFKFFDSDTGTVFNRINEKIVFQANSSIGTLATPYKIITSNVDLTIPLQSGWNWVSMNVRKEDMSLESVLSSINDLCELVVGQTGFSQYYAGKWYGLINRIEPSQMYLLKMVQSATLSYAGEPVYYENIIIYLDKGWNWIGYLPYFEMDINTALQSLSTYGDRIVGQNGFSEYYDGWWGGISTLKPHQGYQIKMHESSSLTYPGTDPNTKKRNANQTKDIHTQKEFQKYQYPACLTVHVNNSKGNLKPEPLDRLIAFSKGGELRGIGKPVEISSKLIFFLPVWLRSSGENLNFEYKSHSNNNSIKIEQQLSMSPYSVKGNIQSPLSFSLRQTTDLELLIQLLQVLAGLEPETSFLDVNDNQCIDLEDVLYLIKNSKQQLMNE
jgi:hypothetical protein